MRFLCLVHVDRDLAAAMTPAEQEVFDRENREYGDWLAADSRAVTFSSLKEPETATLVRSRGGEMSMTDGPYVETKEHLAGYIVVDTDSREEAIAMFDACPVKRIGTLEVRASNYVPPSGSRG